VVTSQHSPIEGLEQRTRRLFGLNIWVARRRSPRPGQGHTPSETSFMEAIVLGLELTLDG